ncbi:MAG: YebC/PmpR family DNA-binding transcriptional regulator, partial [Pseudomonadota bacterium]
DEGDDDAPGAHLVTCAFEDLGSVSKALEEALGEAESVKIVWKPQNRNPVDEEKAGTLMKMLEALDEDDDVQNVFSNEDIADEVAQALAT